MPSRGFLRSETKMQFDSAMASLKEDWRNAKQKGDTKGAAKIRKLIREFQDCQDMITEINRFVAALKNPSRK